MVNIKTKNSDIDAKLMGLAEFRIKVPHKLVDFIPKASTQRPKHRLSL
jgi:hypothetical protein